MNGLKINGTEKVFPEGIPATVADLIEHLGFHCATVVAEIDGQIIKRDNFATTTLRSGQSVELLRFVGGG